MINSRELRLGNAVSDGIRIKIVTMIGYKEGVLGVWLNNPFPSDIGNFLEQAHLDQVQLNPEMLRRCGFDRLTEKSYNGYKASIYSRGDIGMSFYFDDGILTWGLFLPLKIYYLHQLQNLYFALTGTELDVSKLF